MNGLLTKPAEEMNQEYGTVIIGSGYVWSDRGCPTRRGRTSGHLSARTRQRMGVRGFSGRSSVACSEIFAAPGNPLGALSMSCEAADWVEHR